MELDKHRLILQVKDLAFIPTWLPELQCACHSVMKYRSTSSSSSSSFPPAAWCFRRMKKWRSMIALYIEQTRSYTGTKNQSVLLEKGGVPPPSPLSSFA